VTISDLVADLRAPTPSAAAEAVTPDRSAVLEQVEAIPARLARGLRGTLERRRHHLAGSRAGLARGMERRMVAPRQQADLAAARMERALSVLVERRRGALTAGAGRLHALSPLAVLERGYSLARSPEGKVLRRVEELPAGRTFLLRVVDGTVACASSGPVPTNPPSPEGA
jgi:exodeoxyribonuclease VII large subunit